MNIHKLSYPEAFEVYFSVMPSHFEGDLGMNLTKTLHPYYIPNPLSFII